MVQIPLYEQIYTYLKKKIADKEYTDNQQLPTEAELAEMFGVSTITSKRALMELEREGLIYRRRGSGSFVKQAREPSPAASDHPLSEKIVSIILPFEGNSTGMLEYMRGAAEHLNSEGYYLTIHTTDQVVERERELLVTLPKQGVRSIIYYPIKDGINFVELSTLAIHEYPIVTIDKYFEGIPVKSVVSDNAGGGYKLASHLIELGHRKIAFVSSVGLQNATSVRNRYVGYYQALKDHGLKIDSKLVVTDLLQKKAVQDWKATYKQVIRELLDQGVTAIQAENDIVAIELLKCAQELGVRVPADVSIVGFDNTELSAHVDIPLTTAAQDFRRIGKAAAELVVEGIETGSIRRDSVMIPVELVVRESSGPATLREN